MLNMTRLWPFFLLLACEGGKFKSSAPANNPSVSSADQNPIIPVPVEVTPSSIPVPDNGQLFQECNGNPDLPFVADLYQLPANSAKLPDFATLKPIKQICIRQLNITNRDFNDGFPGVEKLIEWFALSIRVKVTVPADGVYTFSIGSDDGSKVFIANELLIDNDGLHSYKEMVGPKTLKAGTYDVRIDYYQGPRYNIALELFMQEPLATGKAYIPAAYLKRP